MNEHNLSLRNSSDGTDDPISQPEGLIRANELFVLELDDRLEFGLAILDPSLVDCNTVGCNNNCNAYSC